MQITSFGQLVAALHKTRYEGHHHRWTQQDLADQLNRTLETTLITQNIVSKLNCSASVSP